MTCSVLSCTRKARRSSTSRLCSLHGSKSGAPPRAAATVVASRIFRKHFRRRCILNWCTAPARKVRFSTDRASIYVCSSHRKWDAPQDITSGRGFRKGYLAAAAPVDDYISGRVPPALLSTKVFLIAHAHSPELCTSKLRRFQRRVDRVLHDFLPVVVKEALMLPCLPCPTCHHC